MIRGLEILEDLKNAFTGHCRELKCETNYIQVCEHKFSKIEKELKALKIIRDRNVAVGLLTITVTARAYNEGIREMFHGYDDGKLAQEEYDLLKEVLK